MCSRCDLAHGPRDTSTTHGLGYCCCWRWWWWWR